ncbi:MAG: hypothetical protein WC880_00715 [Candidatus Paceibacterota bacterium]
MTEDRIQKLEREVQLIRERNSKVGAEKAWEVSWFRIFTITIITYIVACFILAVLGVRNFILNALLPAVGYFLSTQSLPLVKKWWIQNHK